MKRFELIPVKKELIKDFKSLTRGDFIIVEDATEWKHFEGYVFYKGLTFFHKHNAFEVCGIEIDDDGEVFQDVQRFLFNECKVYRLLKRVDCK